MLTKSRHLLLASRNKRSVTKSSSDDANAMILRFVFVTPSKLQIDLLFREWSRQFQCKNRWHIMTSTLMYDRFVSVIPSKLQNDRQIIEFQRATSCIGLLRSFQVIQGFGFVEIILSISVLLCMCTPLTTRFNCGTTNSSKREHWRICHVFLFCCCNSCWFWLDTEAQLNRDIKK